MSPTKLDGFLTALLYYDYALTFGMEVKYMWGRRFRISTMLYVWCRYGLVANVIYLLTIAGKIDHIRVCFRPFQMMRSVDNASISVSLFAPTRSSQTETLFLIELRCGVSN